MGVFVVTGAAGALGSAVASAFVARGDKVLAVVSARSVDKIEKSPNVRAIALDGWSKAIAEGEEAFGPIDGAVLSTGAWAGGKSFAEADEAELDGMIDANLATVANALRGLIPPLVARKGGSIVVVGSRVAIEPRTGARSAAYAASKAAVVALAEATAAENLAHHVRINAVLPSTIDTPANRKAMPDADFGKWVSLPSLAGVILFLASDAARDISGAAIPVYGRA